MTTTLACILAYVALQLAIGMLAGRRVRTEDDYLLAGRRLGPGIAVFTIFATWFGAESCIGSSGKVLEEGLAGATADPFGYGACILLMALVLAGPLWRRRITTLADLFRERYSRTVERLAVLVMVPTSIFWAAAQVRAFGQVLAASSELGPELGIGLAAGVVILYTVRGGLMADAVTDVIQGIVLLVGLAVLTTAVVLHHGGVEATLGAVPRERLDLFPEGVPLLETLEAWAVPILGSIVAQELAARILASRSIPVARWSAAGASLLYVAAGLMPLLIGLLGPGLLPGLDAEQQGEAILPLVAQRFLPALLYAVFAGALVSALLSTVDSALLVSASLLSHNLVLSLRPRSSEAAKVRLARAGVVLMGVLAWAIARSADSIFGLVELASSLGSAGLCVLLFMGLFTRFGGPAAAAAALALGLGVFLAATYFDSATPFLLSLGAALAGYLTVAAFERPGATGSTPAGADPAPALAAAPPRQGSP